MFEENRNYFIRNRYSLAVFILLNTACVVSIGLVFARVAYSRVVYGYSADRLSVADLLP